MGTDERKPFAPNSFGTRMAHARRLLGVREGRDVTVPLLAERIGVSAASVYNWEADLAVPGEANLVKLARELDVTPAFIRYGIGEQPIVTFRIPDSMAETFSRAQAGAAPASPSAEPEPAPKKKAAGGRRGGRSKGQR